MLHESGWESFEMGEVIAFALKWFPCVVTVEEMGITSKKDMHNRPHTTPNIDSNFSTYLEDASDGQMGSWTNGPRDLSSFKKKENTNTLKSWYGLDLPISKFDICLQRNLSITDLCFVLVIPALMAQID